jgi:hypothetical protein
MLGKSILNGKVVPRPRIIEKQHEVNSKVYGLVRAEDVITRQPQWVWRNHILRASQELTTGQSFTGKSQIQCSLAASLTTGKDWPDGTPGPKQPGNVIMILAEDSKDQTVVPRLDAAGAARERITFLLGLIKKDNKDRLVLLPDDMDIIEDAIRRVGNVAAVEIDPITAFMGKIEGSSFTHVRNSLGMIQQLAEKTNTAFTTITHPPKAGGAKAIDAFIGSQAFIAAVRIGHIVVPEFDEEGQPTGRRLFACVGSNVGPETKTLAYKIATKAISFDDSTPMREMTSQEQTPYIQWLGEVAITADQALYAATAAGKKVGKQTAEAFLKKFLADGPRTKDAILDAGKKAGFGKQALYTAQEKLGVQSKKAFGGKAEWSLPEQE